LNLYNKTQEEAEITRKQVGKGGPKIDELNGWYAYFLEEGDFEHWQKYCYMENCKEKRREHLRALWILQRFNLFGSEEWTRMTGIINPLFQKVKADH